MELNKKLEGFLKESKSGNDKTQKRTRDLEQRIKEKDNEISNKVREFDKERSDLKLQNQRDISEYIAKLNNLTKEKSETMTNLNNQTRKFQEERDTLQNKFKTEISTLKSKLESLKTDSNKAKKELESQLEKALAESHPPLEVELKRLIETGQLPPKIKSLIIELSTKAKPVNGEYPNLKIEKVEEIKARLKEAEDKTSELSKALTETQIVSFARESSTTENEDRIKELEEALDTAVEERQELLEAAEKEIEYHRLIAAEIEQNMIDDFEWKLHEIESEYNKKFKSAVASSSGATQSTGAIPKTSVSSPGSAMYDVELFEKKSERGHNEITRKKDEEFAKLHIQLRKETDDKLRLERNSLKTALDGVHSSELRKSNDEIKRTITREFSKQIESLQNEVSQYQSQISTLTLTIQKKDDEVIEARKLATQEGDEKVRIQECHPGSHHPPKDGCTTRTGIRAFKERRQANVLGRKYEHEMEKLEADYSKELATLREEHDRQIKNLEKRLEVALGAKLEHMEALREEVEEEYADRMETLRDMYQDELRNQTDSLKKEKDKFYSLEKSLQETLRMKRNEIERYSSLENDYKSEIDELKERLQKQTDETIVQGKEVKGLDKEPTEKYSWVSTRKHKKGSPSKPLKKSKIETEADLIRIRREIQIMSSVQHPNIIHIYEVFENKEKKTDENGSAKIADFGLSNVFGGESLLNTFCGSPLYASPEIVKGSPYEGPEVDCWSLGVLLYTLVYGAMPFDGSNFKRLVRQITTGDYYEPKEASRASSLIRSMLTVQPEMRAKVEDICAHWWVNETYSESCLTEAEYLASLTPVRLDLLLGVSPCPKIKEKPKIGQMEKPLSIEEIVNEEKPEVNEHTNSKDIPKEPQENIKDTIDRNGRIKEEKRIIELIESESSRKKIVYLLSLQKIWQDNNSVESESPQKLILDLEKAPVESISLNIGFKCEPEANKSIDNNSIPPCSLTPSLSSSSTHHLHLHRRHLQLIFPPPPCAVTVEQIKPPSHIPQAKVIKERTIHEVNGKMEETSIIPKAAIKEVTPPPRDIKPVPLAQTEKRDKSPTPPPTPPPSTATASPINAKPKTNRKAKIVKKKIKSVTLFIHQKPSVSTPEKRENRDSKVIKAAQYWNNFIDSICGVGLKGMNELKTTFENSKEPTEKRSARKSSVGGCNPGLKPPTPVIYRRNSLAKDGKKSTTWSKPKPCPTTPGLENENANTPTQIKLAQIEPKSKLQLEQEVAKICFIVSYLDSRETIHPHGNAQFFTRIETTIKEPIPQVPHVPTPMDELQPVVEKEVPSLINSIVTSPPTSIPTTHSRKPLNKTKYYGASQANS
ncbi:NUAK family SNF1-like kinase 1,Serine/threonine-protein kinase par-1,NUAK family SNF1-like kinase 2 [Lepeophtheirus salmonis]|uniref:NUAK family SNF1-like kinase 1,Serine/threonine-protein kinase par-1,NUAK family SNF1-like kinase 2 n=1 Tax=Lepeophtheirus salmonis TaxID=72036 RepID=A0A7R8CV16_LEPSM|nr:NUAK family SNF1-like kinase 1,Serine/threonine-protein kinase par-1,NUAK family SNF1-like kinase 2 [Lepeophtheirus salmonis]CAF2939923.1 NUAK family SNF1-like kinase 1,Serine/threonine-protein kinase par-1,NUAK family SNF1-like kinase 2 [Lepeophtheirus salmonis]